jgi:transcriptional regulator with XRE-family HTH domain
MSSLSENNFATRLRMVREQKGLSQAELASKTGLQPSAISHFESGRRAPSFDNLARLADALDVTTEYLHGREAQPKISTPTVNRIARYASQMSASDLEIFEQFAEMLAKKNKNKRG